MIQLQHIQYSKMPNSKYQLTELEQDDECMDPPASGPYSSTVVFKAGYSLCQRRTQMEKCLLVTVLLLGIVLIALSIALGVKNNIKTASVCNHPSCISVASEMINARDVTVDPCQDFYQYACGSWIKSNPIPQGHSSWSRFGKLAENNKIILKNALASEPKNAIAAVQKSIVFYKSCMNVSALDSLGAKPLLDVLTQLNKSAHQGVNGSLDLQGLLLRLESLSSNPFSFSVTGDEKNINRNILSIDQGGLILARDQYLVNGTIEDDKVLSAYLDLMVTIMQLLGRAKEETKDIMREVIDFEVTIANITTADEDRRDVEELYHLMTLREFQTNLAPFINWTQMLSDVFSVSNYTIREDEPVVVYAVDFYKNLSPVILQMMSSHLKRRILYSYFEWHVIYQFASSLSTPFYEAFMKFSNLLSGTEGEEARWQLCVSDTENVLGFALGRLYVENAFHGDSKSIGERMVSGVKNAFMKNMLTLTWMDQTTKDAALQKIQSVSDLIGYPNFIFNESALNKRYEKLIVKENSYFENHLNQIRYSIEENLLKLRKGPEKDIWQMNPQEVNAYYSPNANQMVFPAGILQPPFFKQHYPVYVNYGGMGVVMGHELTHGFDDQGREYDDKGNLRMWWTNTSQTRFNYLTECFIKEYTDFTLKDEHLRGKQTLGENIADNGGLKAAFHAYQAWVKENGEEPSLPGLELTQYQLFFLSFAQVWCNNIQPEAAHLSLLLDPHSPGKFRVLGTLKNSVDFAEAFKCPRGSAMNPDKKCQLW